MPTFTSIEAVEDYVVARLKTAVEIAVSDARRIIEEHVDRYYGEYTPTEYVRTKKFLNSLVVSKIRKVGNGWEADVYFDGSKISYDDRVATKTWTGTVSHKWSGEQVVSSVLSGSHGGVAFGSPVWDNASAQIKIEEYEILKKALIAAGIPVS